MNKEMIKPLILGISIIVGVLIYTEQTKYELVNNKPNDFGSINYLVLNKKSGEVVNYYYNYDTQRVEVHKVKKNGENKLEDFSVENSREDKVYE